MNVTVRPAVYRGDTIAVPSKSNAHRLLIAAALKQGNTVVRNVGGSEDVQATARCLCEMGAAIRISEGDAYVTGIRRVKKCGTPDAGESGSTLRFLLPVAAALGADCTFTGRGRLFQRPNEALQKALEQNGVKCDGKSVRGQLRGGRFVIDATVSSQYLSGLLFALPLLAEDSVIELEGEAVSKNYVEMTLQVLEKSCVLVDRTPNGFSVPGGQEYRLPDEVVCEGDWSSGAFMVVAGAFGDGVSIRGLDVNSLQSDKEILRIVKECGAEVSTEKDRISVKSGKLSPFATDIENMPDLAPVLAAFASRIDGVSRLDRVHRLKLKESDRLQAIQDMLDAAGIVSYTENDSLFIQGGSPKCAKFDGKKDHRMVMSEVILAGTLSDASVVTDGEAVKKSYPSFFEDYKKIGGKADVEVDG